MVSFGHLPLLFQAVGLKTRRVVGIGACRRWSVSALRAAGLDFPLLPSLGAPRRWSSRPGSAGTAHGGLEGQVLLPAPRIRGLWHSWDDLRGLGGGLLLELAPGGDRPRGLAERAARRRKRAPAGPPPLLGRRVFSSWICSPVPVTSRQHGQRHESLSGSQQQAGRAGSPLRCLRVSLARLAPGCHSALCDKYLVISLQK